MSFKSKNDVSHVSYNIEDIISYVDQIGNIHDNVIISKRGSTNGTDPNGPLRWETNVW